MKRNTRKNRKIKREEQKKNETNSQSHFGVDAVNLLLVTDVNTRASSSMDGSLVDISDDGSIFDNIPDTLSSIVENSGELLGNTAKIVGDVAGGIVETLGDVVSNIDLDL